MKNTIYIHLFILMLMSAKGTLAQGPASGSPVADGAELLLVSGQFNFTEGPAADKRGNIYFTDQPNDKIWKYDAERNALEVFLSPSGRSNGLFFDSNGDLLACADEHNQLWRIDRNKNVKVVLKGFQGKKFNGPNDVWVNGDKGLYFTDPYYQRSYWQRTKPDLEKECVYYLRKSDSSAVVVESTLKRPNGIVGSADGKFLFVADLDNNKTFKYSIKADGSLTDKTLFVEQGSDGMTIDTQGNVYLTGRGVTVYNSSGQRIAHIPVPESWTGNVCFGGKKRDWLFVTASKGLYKIKMKVSGVR